MNDPIPSPAPEPVPADATAQRAVVTASAAPETAGAAPFSVPPSSPVGAPPAAATLVLPGWVWAGAALLTALVAVTTWMSWETRQQVGGLEQELVKRQQGSSEQSSEARVLARQAQDSARESAAKVSVLEERLAEVGLQRGQLEELIQSLTRSRDENLVNDIEASIRVSLQQASLTGGAEPLAAALRSAEERLARSDQPRLERLRRAVAHDLEKVQEVGVADLGTLLFKLDEAVRLVDELPLVASGGDGNLRGRAAAVPASAASTAPVRAVKAGKAASSQASVAEPAWHERLSDWKQPLQVVWEQVAALVRVTRIDHPEAMLLAPEQAYFVRENLKLRLLNARLSLLSRQHASAEADLQSCQTAVSRYFDSKARKTAVMQDLLQQVVAQGKQVVIPRPDETLAVIATLAATAR